MAMLAYTPFAACEGGFTGAGLAPLGAGSGSLEPDLEGAGPRQGHRPADIETLHLFDTQPAQFRQFRFGFHALGDHLGAGDFRELDQGGGQRPARGVGVNITDQTDVCLLYTSDAADE